MNKHKIAISSIYSFAFFVFFIHSFAYASDKPKLIFFYSPHCHSCSVVKSEFMPGFEAEFKDKIDIEYKNTDEIESYQLLLGLKKIYLQDPKVLIPTCYFKGRFFVGRYDIADNLKKFVSESLYIAHTEQKPPSINLIERFKTFAPLVIISAGLIDGVNPCAFTVIVFFISFLTLQGYKRRDLAIVCLCFIFSVFLTYFLIGLGLFGVLYRLKSFWIASRAFNYLVGIFSILMGAFAVYDYFKFKMTGQTETLILQLPNSIKNRIHSLIQARYRETTEAKAGNEPKRTISKLVASAFVTGFLVSILEGICTGQTYLPTVSFVLKTAQLRLQAITYLLVYNFMFIAPLVIIFLLALLGATSEQFSKFLKQNLGAVKLLMAVLFFALGIFLIWRA